VLTAKALPSSATSAAAGAPAQGALDQIMSEVRFATSITEATPTSIAFTVADRNHDASPETIRYAWSGVSGAPLTREYNGGAAAEVLHSVSSLALGYVREAHTTSTQGTTTQDSGEQTFSTFSGWTGILATQSTGSLSTANWSAEAFTIDRVTIPADASRVAITRVSLKLKKPSSGTAGCIVGIYPPSGAGSSTPATNPIGTPYSVPAASLTTSYAWVDCPFSDVVITPSQTNLIIVVKGVAATTSASIQYLNSLTAPLDNCVYRFNTSSGAAASWQPTVSLLNTNDAYFTVYGSWQRQVTASVNTTTYTLSSLTASLQGAGAGSPRFDTSIETLNNPGIPGP
jgi:hypothetical protein